MILSQEHTVLYQIINERWSEKYQIETYNLHEKMNNKLQPKTGESSHVYIICFNKCDVGYYKR